MTPVLVDDTLIHVIEERLSTLLQAQRRGELPPAEQTEITRIMQTLAGQFGPARLILMAGLPGSGKTTVARELEAQKFLRVCPDERVFEQHGHYGRDFPRGSYKIRERPILTEVAAEVRTALSAGHDIVLDHGLWTRDERQEWRKLGEQAGATVTLVHLPGTLDELWKRVQERNAATFDDPNAMFFSESDLQRHAQRFEAPGSDEPHVSYDGHLRTVLEVLRLADPPAKT